MSFLKPLKLEISNFLGIEKCNLEFSDGVFLILGQNGAGKSSILEAIVFALYGYGVRYGRRSPLSYLRSGSTACEVKYVFLRGGKKYEIVRLIKSSGATAARLSENEKIIATGTRSVEQSIRDIVGVTYETFVTTFLLPQGQSSKMLTSTWSEISRIIIDIFLPRRIFQTLMTKLSETIASKKASEQAYLGQLTDLRSEMVRLEEMNPTTLLTELDSQYSKLVEALQRKREEQNAISQQVQACRELKKLKSETEELFKEEEKLCSQAKLEKMIRLAKSIEGDFLRLEHVKERYSSAKSSCDQIDREISNLQRSITTARKSLEGLREDQENLIQEQKTIKERIEELRKIEELARPTLKELEKLKTQITFTDEELRKLSESLSETNSSIKRHRESLEQLETQLERISERIRALKNNAVLWMANEITRELNDGDVCPVCGNIYTKRHHKEHRQADIALYRELRQKEESIKDKAAEFRSKLNYLEISKGQTQKMISDRTKQKESLTEQAELLLEKLRTLGYDDKNADQMKQLTQKLETLVAQERKIHSQIERQEGKLEENIRTMEQLKLTASQRREELKELQKDYRAAQKVFASKLAEKGLSEEDYHRYIALEISGSEEKLQTVRTQISQLRTRIKELLKVVGDTGVNLEDSVRKLEQDISYLEEKKEEIIRQKTITEQSVVRLKELGTKKRELDTSVSEVQKELEILSLVKKSLGSAEFQAYLVRSALSNVIERANMLLDRLTEGRFSLALSEKGFTIRDVDTVRDASGLSGGEKTLVSLALAVSVAETAAGEMEAFFVDEGFSSLDQVNKEKVSEILRKLEGLNKVIGFVTHDPEFADYFERKLVVEGGKEVHWL